MMGQGMELGMDIRPSRHRMVGMDSRIHLSRTRMATANTSRVVGQGLKDTSIRARRRLGRMEGTEQD